MPATPVSLLVRLRESPDAAAWQRWFDLYGPILHRWLRRPELQAADLDDLTQDILLTVVREVRRFQHNGRTGAFHAWLRQVTVHRTRELRRKHAGRLGDSGDRVLTDLEAPDSALSHYWELEHDRLVLRRLLDLIEPEFTPLTWAAFRRVVLNDEPAEQVAAELSLSLNAVRIAKCRVLNRLRQEGRDLVA